MFGLSTFASSDGASWHEFSNLARGLLYTCLQKAFY